MLLNVILNVGFFDNFLLRTILQTRLHFLWISANFWQFYFAVLDRLCFLFGPFLNHSFHWMQQSDIFTTVSIYVLVQYYVIFSLGLVTADFLMLLTRNISAHSKGACCITTKVKHMLTVLLDTSARYI